MIILQAEDSRVVTQNAKANLEAGGRTGPFPAEVAVSKVVISNFICYEDHAKLNKVTSIVELRMRENEEF